MRAPAAALALLAACGGGGAPSRGPAIPDGPGTERVLLIVLDTLRADHLSLYGYARPTSPALDAFARRATLYRRCQASAPWTLPSHASLFTGLHPLEHGARTWRPEELAAAAARALPPAQNVGRLAERHLTLAEVLAGDGWATAGVVANTGYMDARYGCAQGFDTWRVERAPAEDITQAALEWVDGHAQGPFFLFLNYMDTHRPYNVRPRPGFPLHEGKALKEIVPYVLDPTREPPPELRQALVDQYDLAIANLDEGLGALFEGLEQRGLLDGMLVVVTSDHGEYLGEKDLVEHSKDVYQGALHVPLVVKAPGQRAPRVDEEWISHVHLPSLVLAHCALSDREEAVTRLGPHWPRGSALSENYYSRAKDLAEPWGARFDRVRRARVEGDLKYVESSDGAHELYDLARDPGEGQDLLARDPLAGAAPAAALRALLGALSPWPVPEVPAGGGARLRRELRELGYLGDEEGDEEGDGDAGGAEDGEDG